MEIKEAMNRAIYKLKGKNIEQPVLKARLIMQYTLNKNREYIIVHDKSQLPKDKEIEFFTYIDKILLGIPLQHITHSQEFMKLNFIVNENVLIPRPDTEILVEEVIKIIKRLTRPRVLDLCTGSGAIAISLAKYCNNAIVYASDISEKALEIAKENAKNNTVYEKIKFIKSDLFEKIPKTKFDIIVSNPPYIRTDEIKKLSNEVQNEPQIALDGGVDGLKFYRNIANNAYNYLKYNGYLCLEIGYDQKDFVLDILNYVKRYSNTYCKKDLYNNDRVIVTRVGD